MKLWIFGQSLCLPYDLTEEQQGWPFLLSNQLDVEYKNLAKAGSDNFFIYYSFLENLPDISPEDIVIIGWSHPSRKSFVLDRNNSDHIKALDYSLHYKTKTKEFIRSDVSKLALPDSKAKWLSLSPTSSGLIFYDTWFNNYYSEVEQFCNFQSYIDSVKIKCPSRYFPFYFSKESVKNLTIDVNGKFILDFIIENDVAINNDNYHLNPKGHQLWANHMYKLLMDLHY